MTRLADAIVIDTAELRAAAAALREAERGTLELGLRLPREAWGAPDWLASSAADGLALARRQLDELGADLRAESKRLDARAAEVDSAEQRWWEIGSGGSRCGCVLPSGTVVAQPGQSTAASSASGPGIGDAGAFIGVGAISAAAGTGLGVSVIGGSSDSLFGGITVGQPATTPTTTGTGLGVSVIGGSGDSLFGAPTAGAGFGVSWITGGSDPIFDPAGDAASTAAMDGQFARIGVGAIDGGTGTHIGGAYLPSALIFPESGPVLLAGSYTAEYTTASGSSFLDSTWNRPGDTTAVAF